MRHRGAKKQSNLHPGAAELADGKAPVCVEGER